MNSYCVHAEDYGIVYFGHVRETANAVFAEWKESSTAGVWMFENEQMIAERK